MQYRIFLFCKRILTRASVSPFRFVAYVLHATGLERIYKPRFERHSALMYLTDDIVAKLPKHSLSVTGAKMDPMNIVLVATAADIKRVFKAAGWHRANPASPFHLLYGFITVVAGKSYQSGPFTPHFVNIGLQDFAYQMTTTEKSFRKRHHIRIWRTGMQLPDGKRVWVGAGSFDLRLKLQLTPPFIHHAIDPNLDNERSFIVRSLENQGAYRLKSVNINEAITIDRPKANAYGARYYTDGRAEVVEL